MSRNAMTEDQRIERAKRVVSILRDGEWHSTEELTDATNLTVGQLKGAIKYERRWFLKCPEKCGTTYILSGKKGYKLPTTDEDYLDMYKSLYSWGKSVLITISPIGKYLQEKGFDMKQIREDATNGIDAEGDPLEVGGADSWH